MTCKDCVHYAVCKFMDGEICNHFIDKSRIIELPCKVGDEIYVLNRGNIPHCGCKMEDEE